jgi:hypothetical protein
MNLYCFDFDGAYRGYMQNDGSLFDTNGHRWARLVDGVVYDLEGRCCGRIDAQGSLFDDRGVCWGYLRGWPVGADRRDGAAHE